MSTPHGRIIWSELNTHDPALAKQFFGDTLGWTFEPAPMDGGGTYWIILSGPDRVGGLFPLDDPQFAPVPDHWLTYVGVDDVDHRLALATTAGASIVREAWTIPGIGRVALLRSSVRGAIMAWMTPIMPVPPA